MRRFQISQNKGFVVMAKYAESTNEGLAGRPFTPWADAPIEVSSEESRSPAINCRTQDSGSLPKTAKGRITVAEIAARLSIGRLTVYVLLEKGVIPGIRLGHRWIVTRHAYEAWEETCGLRSPSVLCQ